MALIHYTGKNVLGVLDKKGEIIRILPGVNELEDAKLNSMKEHPLFATRIAKGIIKILGENTDKDGKRSVQEMLTHMPNVFDVKFLKKIIDSDGRPQVVKAAQLQLDKIKNPSKAKEEKDGDHFK